jgi:predicted GIY-YIG superfamily endonuclease
MKFFFVNILQSEVAKETYYVGFTEDLKARLKLHNAGQVPHTSKSLPWKVKTAIAFTDRQRAIEFERYLKSASGRAFAKKRLWKPRLAVFYLESMEIREDEAHVQFPAGLVSLLLCNHPNAVSGVFVQQQGNHCFARWA